MELGRIGSWVGGEATASITVAPAVVAFGIPGALIGITLAALRPSSQDFWGKETGVSIGVISSAMSYIFGRSSKI
jgi:hypothetical protein